MEYFQQLAARTYSHWNRSNRDALALPEAATLALRELPAHHHISSHDIVGWISTAAALPSQLDPHSQFGDPPITLYNDDRLVIDIYFWLASSTSIHQHAFAGAFFVLEGASVETVYDFDIDHRYNESLLTGTLSRREIRLNRQGDCLPILPGHAFIHSLFHLDHSSVSLVIRTAVPSSAPQLEYWYPGIAIQHPSGATTLQRRRLELIPMLAACRPDELPAYLRSILAGASPQEVLWGLQRSLPFFRNRVDELNELLSELRQAYGALITDAIEGFKQADHLDALSAVREQATSPASRLLLALMLNARGPRDLLALTQAHSPSQDPVDEVLRMAAQLLSEAPLSSHSQHLKPEDFPLALAVLHEFLLETPPAEIAGRLAARQPEIPLARWQQLAESLSTSTLFRGLCGPAGDVNPPN